MVYEDELFEVTKQHAKKILIVDDDTEICELLRRLFRTNGYDTAIAYSGLEALNQVEAKTPDLIILDILMPGIDGWETLRRIRSIVNIPVLFLTALAPEECAGRLLKMGTDDYLQKPFSVMELLFRIEALLMNGNVPNLRVQSKVRGQLFPKIPNVSVIIPTLNEAENLPFVLPRLPLDWIDEVILVDGRSTDGTVDVAQKLLPNIKVVLERRPGKGVALRSGFKAAKGDIVITIDADGSTDPAEIPAFVGALLAGADFVKGSRFVQGGGTDDMPLYRKLGNSCLVHLANLLFRLNYTDITYGFNATWRRNAHDLALEFDGWPCEIITNIRAKRNGLRVVEVSCHEHDRILGDAKLGAFSAGWEILVAIIKERFGINHKVRLERLSQVTRTDDFKTKKRIESSW